MWHTGLCNMHLVVDEKLGSSCEQQYLQTLSNFKMNNYVLHNFIKYVQLENK